MGANLGMGDLRTCLVHGPLDGPYTATRKERRLEGKTVRVARMGAFHLLFHHRFGSQLGLRISLVFSTIRFFLHSSHWCNGCDDGVLWRNRISRSVVRGLAEQRGVGWGKLASRPASLRIRPRRLGYHRLEVG